MLACAVVGQSVAEMTDQQLHTGELHLLHQHKGQEERVKGKVLTLQKAEVKTSVKSNEKRPLHLSLLSCYICLIFGVFYSVLLFPVNSTIASSYYKNKFCCVFIMFPEF